MNPNPATDQTQHDTQKEQKPSWLKIRPPKNPEAYDEIRKDLKKLGLATVCQEAHCPNMSECWGSSTPTATFMIMGDTCTRGCRFCSVKTGMPQDLDPLEPHKVGLATKKMGLDYVVITTVNRDELEDYGAAHFAKVIEVTRQMNPDILIEVLIQDFRGREDLIDQIVVAKPDVIAHNIETVPRLQRQVRDIRANYEQSKGVLEYIKKQAPEIFTKSAIMVGLGETDEEVLESLEDLRTIDVEMMTIGQYLRPSQKHLKVEKYIPPEKFEWYKEKGLEMGYLYVASGPFVRSSYKAGELFIKNALEKRNANR